jgi:hypothetical protein
MNQAQTSKTGRKWSVILLSYPILKSLFTLGCDYRSKFNEHPCHANVFSLYNVLPRFVKIFFQLPPNPMVNVSNLPDTLPPL